MDGGDILVRASVWIAVLAVPAATPGRAAPAGRADRLLRAAASAGCAAFLVHVVAAFQLHYGWSHAVAVAETARQTAELTGRAVGAGIWLNYLFALLWTADCAQWWVAPGARRGRPFALHATLWGFLLFIVFNGAVVFVEGPLRAVGLLATVAGVVGLVAAFRARRTGPAGRARRAS